MKTTMLWLSGIGFALLLFCSFPFILIWAINGLFNQQIAYTFMNWLYIFVIFIIINIARNNK